MQEVTQVLGGNVGRLLTSKDIQFIFGVGRNRAYDLMNSSGFPSIRINSRVYVPEDALSKWIKDNIGREYKV